MDRKPVVIPTKQIGHGAHGGQTQGRHAADHQPARGMDPLVRNPKFFGNYIPGVIGVMNRTGMKSLWRCDDLAQNKKTSGPVRLLQEYSAARRDLEPLSSGCHGIMSSSSGAAGKFRGSAMSPLFIVYMMLKCEPRLRDTAWNYVYCIESFKFGYLKLSESEQKSCSRLGI